MAKRRVTGFKRGSNKPKREGTYNIPNEAELAKLENELNKHLAKLDENGLVLKPLTQSQLMGLVRKAIREKWGYCDVKMAYLLKGVEPDYDPDTRRRFKVQCESCKNWFSKGEIQIDHRKGEHSLKSIADFDNFVDSILQKVTFADLSRLCHPCHDLKTAQERYGLSEEDAIIFKRMTAWEAENDVEERKKWLVSKGYKKVDVSNHDKRRACYIEYLKSLN